MIWAFLLRPVQGSGWTAGGRRCWCRRRSRRRCWPPPPSGARTWSRWWLDRCHRILLRRRMQTSRDPLSRQLRSSRSGAGGRTPGRQQNVSCCCWFGRAWLHGVWSLGLLVQSQLGFERTAGCWRTALDGTCVSAFADARPFALHRRPAAAGQQCRGGRGPAAADQPPTCGLAAAPPRGHAAPLHPCPRRPALPGFHELPAAPQGACLGHHSHLFHTCIHTCILLDHRTLHKMHSIWGNSWCTRGHVH